VCNIQYKKREKENHQTKPVNNDLKMQKFGEIKEK
jgi:hypothetical protein